ncbi:hypothetical protein NUW58_g4772 [Xylaria curta]|uniref:Uncharacterized protein n=2 Tax=Xylaria curta TaxID=42375 RepID=A0ACC1NXW3_9PEZI|nr:hypothetical protein NUW58_g6253 [Xylaria curta]KAJ2986964.1 hypothetical protein NUW58_g4772 [Xylaria curta]
MLKYLAWLDAAKFEDKILGAIVRYPFKPSNEYVPEFLLRYNKADLVEGVFTNFLYESTSTSSCDAFVALEALAGFNWYGSREDSLKIDKAVARAVPSWISLLNTWPLCFVVGIIAAEDAQLDFAAASKRRREGELEAPIAAVALAAAGVPTGLLGDPGVGNLQTAVGSGRQVATVFRSSVWKTSIFAVELRIVTTALFRRRELALKEDGLKVNPGRLADGNEESETEDADVIVGVKNLIFEGFTEEEYLEIIN